MKTKLFSVCLAFLFSVCFAVGSVEADIGSINYDSMTNQWEISGFENDGSGNYNNTGIGMPGTGPHIRNGAEVSVNWNGNGGWHYWNGTAEFTDFWHPDTTTWTVSNATFSNTPTNADGFYTLGVDFLGTLGTPIADGTLLNGNFSWESNTGGAGTGVLIYQAAVPEPSCVLTLTAVGAGFLSRRRRTLTKNPF